SFAASGAETIYATAIQTVGVPTPMIVVVGQAFPTNLPPPLPPNLWFAMRFYRDSYGTHPAGDLDKTFACTIAPCTGKVTIVFSKGSQDADVMRMGAARAVDIDADGKIVIAGWADFGATDRRLAVARLCADGFLDNSHNCGAGFGDTDLYDNLKGRKLIA